MLRYRYYRGCFTGWWTSRGIGWWRGFGAGRPPGRVSSLGSFHSGYQRSRGVDNGYLRPMAGCGSTTFERVVGDGGNCPYGLGWMVAGYFLVEYYLYSLGPALVSLPGNILQAVASLACSLPLTAIVRRSRLFSL